MDRDGWGTRYTRRGVFSPLVDNRGLLVTDALVLGFVSLIVWYHAASDEMTRYYMWVRASLYFDIPRTHFSDFSIC